MLPLIQIIIFVVSENEVVFNLNKYQLMQNQERCKEICHLNLSVNKREKK